MNVVNATLHSGICAPMINQSLTLPLATIALNWGTCPQRRSLNRVSRGDLALGVGIG